MTVETRTVWVEELDCCGDPFAIGSTVEWDLYSIDDGERAFLRAVFGEAIAARITDGYERHGVYEPTRDAMGVVQSIEAVSWQVHPLADGSPETDALGLYALPDLRRNSALGMIRTCDTRFRNLQISFRVVALNLYGQVRWGAESVASDT